MKSIFKRSGIWLVVLLPLMMASCGPEPIPSIYQPPNSTFGVIYGGIFEISCSLTLCHVSNENGIKLRGEQVYATLLDSAINNSEAAMAGLAYVKPFSTDSSFLYQKITFDSAQFKFGAPMPGGGLSLSPNEIEYIRQWIAAGAPFEGHVADRSLIE